MSRPAFTERDVAKALAGARKGGFEVGGVQIDRRTGVITLLPAGTAPAHDAASDLDRELQEFRAGHGDG